MIRNQVVDMFPSKKNCVSFARTILAKLPGGLTTITDKIHKMNRNLGGWGEPWQTAIIMTGNSSYGHIAIFTGWSVDENGNNVLSLQDANWKTGFVTNRVYWGSEGESQTEVEVGAGIAGYWVAPS